MSHATISERILKTLFMRAFLRAWVPAASTRTQRLCVCDCAIVCLCSAKFYLTCV